MLQLIKKFYKIDLIKYRFLAPQTQRFGINGLECPDSKWKPLARTSELSLTWFSVISSALEATECKVFS